MRGTLVAQHCQLVPPSGIQERILWSGVLPVQTEETNLSKQPLLLAVFEITRSWLPESILLDSITETLTAAADGMIRSAPLDDQLESILRSVNETLQRVCEHGETDWIGSMNGLIAIIGAEELHFSQTGSIPTYLLSNNKIRQLTENSGHEDSHPLKTFNSLASGSLLPGDTVICGTSELYREFSLDALRRTISNNSPFTALSAIAKELVKEKNPQVAAVCITIHETAGGRQQQPCVINLEDVFESKTKKLRKTLEPIAKKALNLLESGSQRAVTHASTLRSKLLDATKPKEKSSAVVEVIGTEKPTPKKTSKNKFALFFLRTVPRVSAAALHRALLWLQVPQNRRFASLGVAVLIISLITIGVLQRRATPETTTNNIEEALNSVDTQLRDIEAKIAAGSTDSAATLVTQTTETLLALPTPSGSSAQKFETQWKSLIGYRDSLTRTTRFSSIRQRYTVPEQTHSFIMKQPYIYAVTPTSLTRTGSSELAKSTLALPQNWNTASGTFIAAASSSEATVAGYALSRDSKILRIEQIGTQTSVVPVIPESGDIAPGDTIATFASNIYVLDGTSGLVWRYNGTAGRFSAGRSLFDPNRVTLRQSMSMAIDGAFYVLNKNGRAVKIANNTQDESFTLRGIPSPSETITKPSQIYTDTTSNSVFVLDSGLTSSRFNSSRVLEFSKEGTFVRQFAFPLDIAEVTSISVDQRSGILWALSGKEVLEFSL